MRQLSQQTTQTLEDTKRVIRQERELKSHELHTQIKEMQGDQVRVVISDMTSSKEFYETSTNVKGAVEQLYRNVMKHYDRNIYQ